MNHAQPGTAQGRAHDAAEMGHAVQAAVVDMVYAQRRILAAEQHGLGHVPRVHGGHGKIAERSGVHGKAPGRALEHGQQALVAGAVNNGRTQGHQPVPQGPAQNLLHQQLGPAVGGNRRGHGIVRHAGRAVGRAGGRQTGNQHETRGQALAGALSRGLHVGQRHGQSARGQRVGPQIVLPAQAEQQGRHMDDHVLPGQGFGQPLPRAQISPRHGHIRRQMPGARGRAGQAGDVRARCQQARQQMTAHKARAAGDQHLFAAQMGKAFVRGPGHTLISRRYMR